MRKYPEFSGILSQMKLLDDESISKISIQHLVDATKSLKEQVHIDCFHHIIFNFPHLGIENLHSHSSLLAHIMYRAREVMISEPPSLLHVALSVSQSHRWKLFVSSKLFMNSS